MSETLLQEGARFGSYTVAKFLGKGASGLVYLMQDSVAMEFVAVKILSGDTDDARFFREAMNATGLRHPNLVPVYDAAIERETGRRYLVMEYMPRGSLRDKLASHGPLPLDEVTTITADIAAGLAVLAQNSMVHRDVKPGNIMIGVDGTAKLSDFGIVRNMEFGPDSNVTDPSEIVGTPAYMAPEQMLDSRSVDARADIYSLGAVVYEMLTGKRPHEGQSAMTILARALEHHPPPDPRELRPDCPAPLAALVMSMMMPGADDRPADANTVLWLLAHPEKLQGGEETALPWYYDRATLYALVALMFSIEALVVAITMILTKF